MGDLEPAGWERELARHGVEIRTVDDLVPLLKENFGPGPVCLHINSNAVLILHSYSPAKKEGLTATLASRRQRGSAASGTADRHARRTRLESASSSRSPSSWLHSVPGHKSIQSLVCRAYARLTMFGRDACIILSGESGAGKTVACKACIGHLASFSPVCRSESNNKRLGNLLVLIGPLLDAFGNAATTRNDNSSRFGKCIGAVFDFRGNLIGAKIIHYMLERNRVSQRKVGERSFHIFYQLLRGGPGQLLRALRLKSDISNYQYLSRSGSPASAGSTDKSDFAFVLDALKTIGVSEEQITALWQLIAAVLHLGQLKFEKWDEGSTVLNRSQLTMLAELAGISESDMEQFLCFSHCVGGDVRVGIEEAVRRRDILAQAIYDQIFLWLIQVINGVLRPQPDESDSVVRTAGYHETYRNINIVDLYGFEQQEASSFEQMCMNYSCEKLHQVFIANTIKDRLTCFQQEGVPSADIMFSDNSPVCDLFDNTNQGVFTLLDRATCDQNDENPDKSFLDFMDTTVAGHDRYTSRQVDPSDTVLCPFLDFRVQHFAGGVTYTIDGFVSSNTDVMTESIPDLFLRSSNEIMKDLGIHQTRGEMTPNSTVGVNFRNAITNLTDSIEHQDAYHIRCLKPNDTKSQNHFDEVKVRQQCEDLLLCEAHMVEQIGHVYQISYSDFFRRYHRLVDSLRKFRGTLHDGCKQILKRVVPGALECVTFGQSMMFMRSLGPMQTLDEEWDACMVVAEMQVAKSWRAYKLRQCLRTIQQRFSANSSSIEWPAATTPSTAHLITICQKAHRKWLYNRLLSTIPLALRPDMRLKTTGYSLLGGKRQKWGFNRRWHGDYLAVNPAFRSKLKTIKKEAKFENVLFSSKIRKVNKKLKVQDRCILVTDSCIVFLDDGFSITKAPIGLEDVVELRVSSGHDQGMALCCAQRRDYLFSLQFPDVGDDFVGEMVSVICQSISRKHGMCPQVVVGEPIRACLGGENVGVEMDYQFNVKPEFKKTGSHSLTLLWPFPTGTGT